MRRPGITNVRSLVGQLENLSAFNCTLKLYYNAHSSLSSVASTKGSSMRLMANSLHNILCKVSNIFSHNERQHEYTHQALATKPSSSAIALSLFAPTSIPLLISPCNSRILFPFPKPACSITFLPRQSL